MDGKKWGWFILKLGGTLIGMTALGTWATRRTTFSPLWRGVLRAGVATGVAIALRKKAPAAAIGSGVYALSTIAEGLVEEYDVSRYLAMTDAQRSQALGAGAQSGATTQGQPQQMPAGAGPSPVQHISGHAEYQRNGYAVV